METSKYAGHKISDGNDQHITIFRLNTPKLGLKRYFLTLADEGRVGHHYYKVSKTINT